jgi:hypothetical protein
LIFEKNEFRTPKINEVVSLICNVGKDFKGRKKGKDTFLSNPSHRVIPFGFEPKAYGLENRCSIQLSYGIKKKLINAIGKFALTTVRCKKTN